MSERILLVDDHPLTRSALAGLLQQHGFEIAGEAADGEEAIARAREIQPDLVLLDLSMPGLDGLSALPRLREAAPSCEVVVLTASGEEENLLGAIRAGAAGYLLKSEPPARIVEFLRGAAQGEAALSGAVARRLLEQVRENGGRTTGVPDQIAAALSARELEVLLLLGFESWESPRAGKRSRHSPSLGAERPAPSPARLVFQDEKPSSAAWATRGRVSRL